MSAPISPKQEPEKATAAPGTPQLPSASTENVETLLFQQNIQPQQKPSQGWFSGWSFKLFSRREEPQPINEEGEQAYAEEEGQLSMQLALQKAQLALQKAYEAANKVQQASQVWLADKFIGASASYLIGKAHISVKDKQEHIETAYKKIQHAVPDAHEYIQLAKIAITQIPPLVEKVLPLVDKISGLEAYNLGENLTHHKDKLQDLIEVNFTVGLANLAEQTAAHKKQIPNYEDQSTLVNIISLLSSKVQGSPALEAYRKDQATAKELLNNLFPGFENDHFIYQAVDHFIGKIREERNNPEFDPDYRNLLFPPSEKNGEQNTNYIRFLKVCDSLANYPIGDEKDVTYSLIADEILTMMFPHKVNDLVINREAWVLKILNRDAAKDGLYAMIRNMLKNYLKKSNEQLNLDPARKASYEAAIKEKVPAEMMVLVKALSARLKGYLTQNIQKDPSFIVLISSSLSELNKQTAGETDQLMTQLSLDSLAGWLVSSVQSLLYTDDPALLKTGSLVDQILNNISLILLARGVKEVNIVKDQVKVDISPSGMMNIKVLNAEEQKEVSSRQFVRNMIDQLIEKIKTIQEGQTISPEVLREFINELELPLPAFLKNMGADYAVQKLDLLEGGGPLLNRVDNFYDASLRKIQQYRNSGELIAISQNLSSLILSKTEKVTDISESRLEEVMESYLPGIKFDKSLAEWLKNNLKMFAEGDASAKLTKKGIQSIILTALDQTIQTSFKGNGEDYAAQLLQRFNDAAQAFRNLSDEELVKLRLAYSIQEKIDKHEKYIAKFKNEIEMRPDTLPTDVDTLFRLKRKELQAVNSIRNLEQKQKALFAEINKGSLKEHWWTAVDIDRIEEALAYRSTHIDTIETDKKRYKTTEPLVLILRKDQMEVELSQPGLTQEQLKDKREELRKMTTLAKLIQSGPESLKLFSELLNVKNTLHHAIKDRDYYSSQIVFLPHLSPEHRQYIVHYLTSIENIYNSNYEVERLNAQLNKNLQIFSRFSNALTVMFGLDDAHLQKDKLLLPEMVKDMAWDKIEWVRKDYLPQFLFKQLAGALKPLLAKNDNIVTLKKLSGLRSWSRLATAIARDAVATIQEKVTDFNGIAKYINNKIPGAKNLHLILAPQLQQIFNDDKSTFVESRGFIEDYIESLLLNSFVSMAKTDSQHSITDTIKNKLSHITIKPAEVAGKSDEELAEWEKNLTNTAIDEIMRDVFHVSSPMDLEGVPPLLQEIVYDSIKEQVFKQVSVILKPMIERDVNRQKLLTLSGSNTMSLLAEQISKNIFSKLPFGFSSYQEISLKIFRDLAGKEPESAEAELMNNEINKLVQNSPTRPITNKAILATYEKATGRVLPDAERKEKLLFLHVNNAKEDIQAVILTPADITKTIAGVLPHIDEQLQKQIVAVLQTLTHSGGQRHEDIAAILGQYIEGMTLRLFIRIAEKNPAVTNAQGVKDSILVIYDKLIELVSRHAMQVIQKGMTYDLLAALNKDIMEEVLNIPLDSDEALEGIPLPIQKMVHEKITEQIGSLTMMLASYLTKLMDDDPDVILQKEDMRKLAENEAQEACAVVALNDFSKMFIPNLMRKLATTLGDDTNFTYGATMLAGSVELTLEDFEKTNLTLASALLNYARPADLMQRLDVGFKGLDANKEVKDVAATMLGNFLLAPLNRLLTRITEDKGEKAAEFNQTKMAGLLNVLANFLETRKKALGDGKKPMTHAGFIYAAGKDIHPGVPVKKISFEVSIKEISERLVLKDLSDKDKEKLKEIISRLVDDEYTGVRSFKIQYLIDEMSKHGFDLSKSDELRKVRKINEKKVRLKDVIRKEGDMLQEQRLENAYLPMSKEVMDIMFPNGKKDLEVIPPQLRELVWKQFRTNLLPIILQTLVEIVFDENMMTELVLKTLEALKETLEEPITSSAPVRTNPILAKAGGKLVRAFMSQLENPEEAGSVRNRLVNALGEKFFTSDKVDEVIGNLLTGVFNENFIKDKLAAALQSAAARDKAGEPMFKADLRPRKLIDAEKAVQLEKTKKEISAMLSKVIDVSANYNFRYTFFKIRENVANAAEKLFGSRGKDFVNACMKVFEFIYVNILSTIISVLIYPLRPLRKAIIYKVMRLESNKDKLLKMLTFRPEDQPEKVGYPIFYEDLANKMLDVISGTVIDSIANPQVRALPE